MALRNGGVATATPYNTTVVYEGREAPAADGFYARWGKTAIDRMGAAVLLVLAAPVLLVVTLLVLATLGHPVVLRQQRVGMGGRRFDMLKFRTMEPDRRARQQPLGGPDRRVSHKTLDDPRHTPVGKMLRKLSLDELPQLWNVLRGDMSLVGPRPEMSYLVDRFEPWQHARHQVRPGLTGLWQTSARGTGRIAEFIHLDVEYIRRMSLWTDVKLLVKTVPVLLRPRSF